MFTLSDQRWRVISLLLAFVLLFSGLLFGGAADVAAQEAPESAQTTARLNFRTGPALSYDVVRVLAAGTEVEFTGLTNASGEWVEVMLDDGTEGWVAARYLTYVPADLEEAVLEGTLEEEPFPPDVVTAETTVNLNLREGPGTFNVIVDVIPAGTEVGFTGFADESGDWVQIDPVGAETGWVAARFLTNLPATLAVRPVAQGPESFASDVVTSTTIVNLNLRQGPGLAYEIIETLPRGTVVGFTGFADEGGEWVQIDPVDAEVGWVAARYLNSVPGDLAVWEGTP